MKVNITRNGKSETKKSKPGPAKTKPTLRHSDCKEESIDAEGLVLRAQMIKDGFDPGPRPRVSGGVEAYRALPKCGAKRTGPGRYNEAGEQQYCQQVAGARTDHLGVGKCWLHGGRSKGVKLDPETLERRRIKQIKTGEQETITYDSLTPEEQEIWGNISVTSETQLEHDLRIITIRERRMLNRMNELLEEGKMSIVEDTDEKKQGIDGLETKKVKKSVANLERMTALEDALTRVGKQKINIMEALEKVRNGGIDKKSVSLTVGGKKGSPVVIANMDLSNVPTEELQRQLNILEELEDDDD